MQSYHPCLWRLHLQSTHYQIERYEVKGCIRELSECVAYVQHVEVVGQTERICFISYPHIIAPLQSEVSVDWEDQQEVASAVHVLNEGLAQVQHQQTYQPRTHEVHRKLQRHSRVVETVVDRPCLLFLVFLVQCISCFQLGSAVLKYVKRIQQVKVEEALDVPHNIRLHVFVHWPEIVHLLCG